MHTHVCLQMSQNTTVQTHVHRQGAHERLAHEIAACAAASRRRRDLVRLPTAGKTEFVKSEAPLMRKNTDPYPTRLPANQKQTYPGNKDSNRAAEQC